MINFIYMDQCIPYYRAVDDDKYISEDWDYTIGVSPVGFVAYANGKKRIYRKLIEAQEWMKTEYYFGQKISSIDDFIKEMHYRWSNKGK